MFTTGFCTYAFLHCLGSGRFGFGSFFCVFLRVIVHTVAIIWVEPHLSLRRSSDSRCLGKHALMWSTPSRCCAASIDVIFGLGGVAPHAHGMLGSSSFIHVGR